MIIKIFADKIIIDHHHLNDQRSQNNRRRRLTKNHLKMNADFHDNQDFRR